MIIKAKLQDNYVVIPNGLAQHRGLSFRARGMLLYILSKPTDWIVRETDLMKEGLAGRDQVRSVIKELVEVGYLKRLKKREAGKFDGVEYVAHPSVSPSPEKPSTEKPTPVNPTHTKERDIQSTESTKSIYADKDFEVDKTENNLPADTTHEWDLEAFEIWWSAFPNQFQKKKAKQAYMVAMRKTDCATLLRGAEEYARQNKTTSTEYIKRPENWLREEMWDDYQPQPKAKYLWDGNVVEVTPDVAAQFNMTKIKG